MKILLDSLDLIPHEITSDRALFIIMLTLLLHERRIQEILPQRMAQWKKTASVADHKAEEFLTKLAKRKEVSLVNSDVFSCFY